MRHHTAIATHAVEAWARWVHTREDEGWPPKSMTAVALESRLGRARTPPGPRVPRFRRRRSESRTERLMADLPRLEGLTVGLAALMPSSRLCVLASELAIGPRHFRRQRASGLERLGQWLEMSQFR